MFERTQDQFEKLRNLDLPVNQYAITGSGPIGIRGLREIHDIDLIVADELWNTLAQQYGVVDQDDVCRIVFPGQNIEAFREGSFPKAVRHSDAPSVAQRIAESEIIDGLPFESLAHVLYYKRQMGREKDLRDVQMIQAWQAQDWFLDEYRPADTKAFLEYLQEQEIHENTLNIPWPYTENDAEKWIAIKAEETRRNGRVVAFVIRTREGHVIGAVGFDGLMLSRDHVGELGYWLAKPYWNLGIMTLAIKAVCKIAFEEWGLVRIQAQVFSTNPRSAHLLEKCGFVREGLLRRYLKKGNDYKDVNLYALINERD
jgi:ribosomal-protein-alanine N-acetyltransferase